MRKYNFEHWGGKLPKISCQCITFGRPVMLNEAVECFHKQDYPGEKELIILNDHPDVIHLYDHPEVKVVNRDYRYDTVGEKRNECVKLCTGDLILPWDDDDISLPWRMSIIVQEMRNHHYFKPKSYWTWAKGNLRSKPTYNTAHAMGGFSREIFDKVGGYKEMQSGQDTSFEEKMMKTKLRDLRDIPAEDLYYIYRFAGTGSYHLSAFGVGNGYRQAMKHVAKQKVKGEYPITPKWRQDYVAMTAASCEKWKEIKGKDT